MRPEVNALFREVADRTPEQRHDYYTREAVPEALRAEVESLLQYDDPSNDSLQGYIDSAQRLIAPETTSRTHEEGVRLPGAGLPARIGRFEVTRLLGRGGMGEVYLARDPVIDRLVAIKLIGGGLEFERGRRHLLREARAAGRLQHPNIVTVFEAGEFEDRSFIAMEYVSGETLGRLIRHRTEMTLRRRIEMIEGACAGLAHAHRAGVIHLDIKPDNLMLTDTGIVKVLDFGISRVMQNQTVATAQGAGTLRYMSPEQIQGKPLDHRSDVFSLGCSLFELVSYAPAFSGSTKEIVTHIAAGPVPSLVELSSEFDHRLDHIIRRSMSLDPAQRYDDLEEMRADLARVRAALDPAADTAYVSPLPDPFLVARTGERHDVETGAATRAVDQHTAGSKRRAPIVAAAAAVLLVAGGTAITLWNRSNVVEDNRTANVEATPVAPPAPIPSPSPAPSESPAPPASAPTPAATAPQDDVWRRLARGDRPGVVEWLATHRTDTALAAAVVDTLRTSVMQTRASATASETARTSDSYGSAEEQLARANRFATSGRSLDALQALWQASDAYARSLTTPPAQTAAAPEGKIPPPPVAPPPASTGSPVTPEVTEAPTTTAAPDPNVAAAKPAPAPPPPAPEAPSDTDAIANTLRGYDAAYKALDVAALVRVFPSLGRDQVEQLRRTFEGMSTYEMDTRVIRTEVMNNSATVLARVARRMTPRVGNPVVNDVETEFRLQRSGGGWIIASVRAR